MLGRRRVFAVGSLGGRDGAIEDLAHGCVVPGATSIYRRIPDATCGGSLDSWRGGGRLRGDRRPPPLLKLASRDSGVEMVVGDSPLATYPGFSLDSLNLEPMESSEPAAQRDRLLASQKLEQVLERARGLPRLPGQSCSPPEPERGAPAFAAEQEPTEAETKLEAGLEEAEVGSGMGPEAWACLPGQGLRYLEHLCLVLEQMARLQQLYLQLHSQRPLGDPDEEEVAVALVHSSSPSPAPDYGAQGLEELLSQTKETGTEALSVPKLEMLSTSLPRLSEAPVEAAHTFPPSRRHKDLSHWDKVKVLLNRIRWRSSRHLEPAVTPDGAGPKIESRDLSEMPSCCRHQKTLMPSLMLKKSRAKNLSVC